MLAKLQAYNNPKKPDDTAKKGKRIYVNQANAPVIIQTYFRRHVVSKRGLRIRKGACIELFDSEKSYITALNALFRIYATPLTALTEKKGSSFTKKEFGEIFLNLKDMIPIHTEFLHRLGEKMNSWDDTKTTIGDNFAVLAGNLQAYVQYCSGCANAVQLVKTLISKNKDFKKICEAGAACGETLEQFLARPLQRIQKYNLLLETISKATTFKHPDYHTVSNALVVLSEESEIVSTSVHAKENLEKVTDIEKKMKKYGKPLVAPSRTYVFGAVVTMINAAAVAKRVLFLFTDLLLLVDGASTDAKSYEFKEEVDLRRCEFASIGHVDDRFLLLVFTESQTYLLSCENELALAGLTTQLNRTLQKLDPTQQDVTTRTRGKVYVQTGLDYVTYKLVAPDKPKLWEKYLRDQNIQWGPNPTIIQNPTGPNPYAPGGGAGDAGGSSPPEPPSSSGGGGAASALAARFNTGSVPSAPVPPPVPGGASRAAFIAAAPAPPSASSSVTQKEPIVKSGQSIGALAAALGGGLPMGGPRPVAARPSATDGEGGSGGGGGGDGGGGGGGVTKDVTEEGEAQPTIRAAPTGRKMPKRAARRPVTTAADPVAEAGAAAGLGTNTQKIKIQQALEEEKRLAEEKRLEEERLAAEAAAAEAAAAEAAAAEAAAAAAAEEGAGEGESGDSTS